MDAEVDQLPQTIDENYLSKLTSIEDLDNLRNQRLQNTEDVLRRKTYEIERLLEENKYIKEETVLQTEVRKKALKRFNILSKSLEKLESHQTSLLLEIFSIKENILVQKNTSSQLKQSYHQFYQKNNELVRDLMKIRKENEEHRNQLKKLSQEKPVLLDILSENIREKGTKEKELSEIQMSFKEQIEDLEEKVRVEKLTKNDTILEKEKRIIKLNLELNNLKAVYQDLISKMNSFHKTSGKGGKSESQRKELSQVYLQLKINREIEIMLTNMLSEHLKEVSASHDDVSPETFFFNKLKMEKRAYFELIRNINNLKVHVNNVLPRMDIAKRRNKEKLEAVVLSFKEKVKPTGQASDFVLIIEMVHFLKARQILLEGISSSESEPETEPKPAKKKKNTDLKSLRYNIKINVLHNWIQGVSNENDLLNKTLF